MKPIPALDRAAFLLDMDGTLIDIAPTPGSVVVPPGLTDSLHALRRACADAVAVVTGRPIDQVDALLGDAPFAVAGEHGAAIRHAPGLPIIAADLPSAPQSWIDSALALAARHPGAAVERKRHGFVLHYRAVPDMAEVFRLAMQTLLADRPTDFVLLAAKMAWEIRPLGVDKGHAVAALMASSPFAGRRPVYVGDDVTDHDGIAAAERLGGVGFLVGRDFSDAAAVRRWLVSLVGGAGRTGG
jgi:trehalose 6-phosphate phosphatase